jgi:predicted transcriptional regulator
MTQITILRLLEKNPDRWFSSNDVTHFLNENNTDKIRRQLKKLRESNLVKYSKKRVPGKKPIYVYQSNGICGC